MTESKYYDGTKLLSLKDINGNKPELYIVTTNRTGGKTTYFGRYFVNKFKKNKEKFCLLYRYNYELDDVETKFFKDIHGLFFQSDTMTAKKRAKGIYYELFLNDDPCGYVISMNSADQIKKYSHVFSDVCRILLDEFQSESNNYCDNEVKKFQSIHTSIARGNGEQVRYVPVYMCGNNVTLLNPYYIELGISTRIQNNTRFLKGDGFVLESGFIETASNAQKNSAFNRAFANSEYTKYSSENVYLNDNNTFIGKPSGTSRYLATIRYNGKDYALREFVEMGYIYCDDKVDYTFPNRLAITTNDHRPNYVLLKRYDMFFNNMRFFFERGCFRFKDLQAKEAVLKMLEY